MAGEIAGFDAALFRTNIRNTMVMGTPVPVAERPTFHFPPGRVVYPVGTKLDSEGRPIDPRIKGVAAPTTPIQVACAVEFAADSTNNTQLAGTFWASRATITLLDTEYAQVQGAIEVDLAARRYIIQELAETGLGPVTVYTLLCFRKGVEET